MTPEQIIELLKSELQLMIDDASDASEVINKDADGSGDTIADFILRSVNSAKETLKSVE
jgi:uncharacterized protein (DUF1778 family)